MKAIHRFRILRFVKLSDKQKMFLDFKKWVKSIQTMGYDGASTVYAYETERLFGLFFLIPLMHYSFKKNRRSSVGFGMN